MSDVENNDDAYAPTDYALELEDKHKRKVILPSAISWEYGSNKFASMQGTRPFGSQRLQITQVNSTKQLSESNDGVIPLWEHKKLSTQAGSTPFGGIHEVIHRTSKDGVAFQPCHEMGDKKSERFLHKWGHPPNAKNSDVGKRRNQCLEVVGGRRWTADERRMCEAVMPKLIDTRTSVSPSGTGAGLQGFHNARQVTTKVTGCEFTSEQDVQSKLQLGWVGGWKALSSQSRTGGFFTSRDVAAPTYYTKPIKKEATGRDWTTNDDANIKSKANYNDEHDVADDNEVVDEIEVADEEPEEEVEEM